MGGCSSSASVSKSSKMALEQADNPFNTSQCVHPSYRRKSDPVRESNKGRKDIPLTGVRLVTLHEADDSKNSMTNTHTNGINTIHERGAKLEELQRNISDVQKQLEENCAKLHNVGVSLTPKQTIEEDNNNAKETNVTADDTVIDDTQVMSAKEHETLEDFNKTGHVTDGQIKKILNQFKEKLDEGITLTKTECALASKANALRIKRGCDKISNVEWMNTNGQYSFNARQFLSILSQSYSFLSSIDEIEYLEETRKSIANVVLHAGIIDKICEVVVTIYRKNAVPDWNLSGLWTPLYYALSILWDYTDTSEEWTEKLTANESFMEILHKVLNDISETDGESNSSVSTINRGSYMSAYVLLNLLNKFGKWIKCEACRAFYHFFTMSSINAITHEQEYKFLFIT